MILENKKKGNNGIIFTLVLPYDNFCMEKYGNVCFPDSHKLEGRRLNSVINDTYPRNYGHCDFPDIWILFLSYTVWKIIVFIWWYCKNYWHDTISMKDHSQFLSLIFNEFYAIWFNKVIKLWKSKCKLQKLWIQNCSFPIHRKNVKSHILLKFFDIVKFCKKEHRTLERCLIQTTASEGSRSFSDIPWKQCVLLVLLSCIFLVELKKWE